jgi:uncharacterized SAM-binding protein YcdF (DUF218 family)
VIFGAAVRPDGSPSTTLLRRVQAAAVFGRRFDDPLYVPTGAVGRFGPSEASVMAGLLRDLGVQGTSILREETGHDPLSSARAVARLLQTRGHAGPVFAVSSAYHLPRCILLLRMAGLPAHAGPPPPFPAAQQFRKRWYWRLRELAALPFDIALMLALRLMGRG